MDLVLFLLTLAVVAVIVAIALGRLPGGMPEPASTVPVVRLPSGPLIGSHVHELRFAQGLRGYRMDQVDDALDRLAREVDVLRGLVPPDVLRAHDQDRPPQVYPQEPHPPQEPFPTGVTYQPSADVNGGPGPGGGAV